MGGNLPYSNSIFKIQQIIIIIIIIIIIMNAGYRGGHAVAQLRYCATSRKVTGSIPDGVIEIFH